MAHNSEFIQLMETLADIMLKRGEPFRARAYQKAQETIMSYPSDICSLAQLKNLPNIGKTIMEKLNEYVQTGTLQIIELEKKNPVNIFTEIYGVGPKKAKELVEHGITSIEQLRENKQLLNDIQCTGLRYYEDILKRIPRSEIEDFKTIFTQYFDKLDTKIKSNTKFEIVGSYRRNATTSGDIDIIITSPFPDVFKNFIEEFIANNIIVEVLSRGSTKCLVIAKLPTCSGYRRVDFLYTSKEEFPFAILYFTGSKHFNTMMRQRALTLGYTMNEHGLCKLSEKKQKCDTKVPHVFNCEKDIFDYLQMEYKEPHERIDGRSVVLNTIQNEIITEKENVVLSTSFVETILNEFKIKGITVLNDLNEKQLFSILSEADKCYYNHQPILTDSQYDIILNYAEHKYKKNTKIGAPVERNKAILPYMMPSMDKIKPDTDSLTSWTSKFTGPYVISCKLDGVSGLYTTEPDIPQLYTRGDGKTGQNISHLIPYLQLPKTKGIVIRGEFIILKETFTEKYAKLFANPRNMVAGIINNKAVHEYIHDVKFVAYEVIKPVIIPSKQMEFLSTIDIQSVLYKLENKLTNETLSQILVDLRTKYLYEIDGLIVTNDAIYERNAGNPIHSFAFKMVLSEQIAEATVVDVLWTPSKYGYLKPRIQISPIQLGGVCVEYTTGFNGAFIRDNNIGIGTIVEIIRSGDVIPHIRKVIVPAETPKMPDVSYIWNTTNIDIILENSNLNETVREKNITGFFKGIGVDGLSSGNISRIIQAGFNTISSILKMNHDDFLKIDGFQLKMATKLYEGIKNKINTASLITIMAASNIFGRGFSEKKLELIMMNEPTILLSTDTNQQKVTKISAIKGMANKSAETFILQISEFIQFMKEAKLEAKLVLQKN